MQFAGLVAVYALIRRKRLLLIAIAFPLVYFLWRAHTLS